MNFLFKLFLIVLALVFLVPLLWVLIREIWLLTGNLLTSMGVGISIGDLGYILLTAVFIVLFIIFLKMIFD